MDKEKIKIHTTIDINMMGKSYIQLETDKGNIIIEDQKQADEFLEKYEVVI